MHIDSSLVFQFDFATCSTKLFEQLWNPDEHIIDIELILDQSIQIDVIMAVLAVTMPSPARLVMIAIS